MHVESIYGRFGQLVARFRGWNTSRAQGSVRLPSLREKHGMMIEFITEYRKSRVLAIWWEFVRPGERAAFIRARGF